MSRTIRVTVDAELLRQALRLPDGVFIEDAEGVTTSYGVVQVALTLSSPDFEEHHGEPPELTPIITRIPERVVWDFGGVKLP